MSGVLDGEDEIGLQEPRPSEVAEACVAEVGLGRGASRPLGSKIGVGKRGEKNDNFSGGAEIHVRSV